MEDQENNPVIQEIEKEIEETKRKASDENFEIEITEEKEDTKEETTEVKEPKETPEEYGKRVQRRMDKINAQKARAEKETLALQEHNAQMQKRLERLEQENAQRNQSVAQNDFAQRYDLTKKALTKAVEEGDTEAQVNFSEQLADMRASIRVGELQKNMQNNQPRTPTEPRQRQRIEEPTPELATQWWKANDWFNQKGYERESAAARAIDVQLDIEGFDKNSSEYYENLNSRLQKVFPELISNVDVAGSKPRAKSSKIVTPSAGGSSYKSNRVRMTQDQLRMARELGINDEASLKKYASEIQKSQRS